jgi:hypothetical protein
MVSAAVACLPAADSLLLLEALFMQISGVSLALTWPCRLCLLRVLLCTSATSFPLSKHTGGGDTAPTFSGLRVYYSSRGKWVFSPLLWSFPPSATLTSFPTPGCWARAPLLPEPLRPGPACLFTVPGRILLSPSSALSMPHLLCNVSLLFLWLITQFLFFPQVEVGLSRGLCCSGPGLSVAVPCTT